MLQKIKESVACISKQTTIKPQVAVVLGSGLGDFVHEVEVKLKIPYSQIPYFPVPGVDGHEGALLFAFHKQVPLVIMQGRAHFYEGYSMDEVTYPLRVFKYLGIDTLFLSNAAGGMNPDFKIGDLMVIADHINMMPNPLVGEHVPEFGSRFPDMSEAYNKKLIEQAFSSAKKLPVQLKKGCYIAVTGPTYETSAEYRFFRTIGGDAVGMSTVPEVIVAHQMGIKCFAMSVITDLGVPGKIEYLTHEKVKKAAQDAEPKLAMLLKDMIGKVGR
ncbi:MAG: purine-nucleoside phosphorylase [Bacteroidales bacterium]|nr:purine-nucleoside phosphorylase [Bacteroidales bacterium]